MEKEIIEFLESIYKMSEDEFRENVENKAYELDGRMSKYNKQF